jgi:hypothetical protein
VAKLYLCAINALRGLCGILAWCSAGRGVCDRYLACSPFRGSQNEPRVALRICVSVYLYTCRQERDVSRDEGGYIIDGVWYIPMIRVAKFASRSRHSVESYGHCESR